jgi:hypothetical protein
MSGDLQNALSALPKASTLARANLIHRRAKRGLARAPPRLARLVRSASRRQDDLAVDALKLLSRQQSPVICQHQPHTFS